MSGSVITTIGLFLAAAGLPALFVWAVRGGLLDRHSDKGHGVRAAPWTRRRRRQDAYDRADDAYQAVRNWDPQTMWEEFFAAEAARPLAIEAAKPEPAYAGHSQDWAPRFQPNADVISYDDDPPPPWFSPIGDDGALTVEITDDAATPQPARRYRKVLEPRRCRGCGYVTAKCDCEARDAITNGLTS